MRVELVRKPAPKPGFHSSSMVDGGSLPEGGVAMQLLAAASAECASLLSSTAAVEGEARDIGAGGFSQVLDMMRRCGRPAVAHNALNDLVFMMQVRGLRRIGQGLVFVHGPVDGVAKVACICLALTQEWDTSTAVDTRGKTVTLKRKLFATTKKSCNYF
jgi:hypothetical protein